MPAYEYLNFGEGELPVSEQLAKEVFSLPLYPTISDDDQASISNRLIEIVGTQ